MAQTPEEIKAKKIAKKKAQIKAVEAQIDKYETKKKDANSVRDYNIYSRDNTNDAKIKAKNEKTIAVLDKRIVRLQATIDRFEAKRKQYNQELAALMGPY